MVAVPVTFAMIAAVGFVAFPTSAHNPRPALVASAGDAFSDVVETLRTVWGRLFAAEETPTLLVSPQAVQPSRPSIPISTVASTTPVHKDLIATRPNAPIQPIQQVQGKQTVVNQPVIERIVERVVQGAPASLAGYVTQAEFVSQINILKDEFGKTLYGTTYPTPSSSYASGGIMNVVAQMGRIDNLANTTITNPTITGGSITAASIIGSISNAISSAVATIADLTSTTITATNVTFTNSTTTNATTTNLAVTGTATSTFGGGISATAFNLTGTATSTAANGFNIASGCFAVNGTCVTGGGGGSSAWGSITGTLSSQSDLQAALNAKLSLSNWYATTTTALAEGSNLYFTTNRVASVIAGTTTDALAQGSTNKYWSNTLFDNRLSATTTLSNLTTLANLATVGTITSGTWNGIAIGDAYISSAATWNAKEPAISAGTINDYWRGDKTFQATSTLRLTKSQITDFGTYENPLTVTYPLTRSANAISTAMSSSTLTASSPLTGSFAQVGTGGSLGIQAASASQNGYLAAADYSLLHTATTTFSAPLVYTGSTNAVTLTTSGTWSGNAGTATKLAATKNINGVAFDGSADITIAAASSTLLANNNTFTGLNTFGNATSTLLSYTTAWGGTLNLTTALTVANGGTGATTLTGIVKGNGTSAFTAAAAGTDYVAPATTITAGAGLSGGGDLSTSRTLTLNLGNTNSWTGLQTFANSSSTLASVFNTLYVGGTATSTIQGNTTGTSTIQGFLNVAGTNSTSTFSGGLAATYLNLTGTAATSTAANGFNLTAGCFSILGTCVGGGSSQWTTSGSNIYYTAGSVFIGTTTPGRMLTVFNTSANPQQRISYDATRYAELYADASGALNLTTTGKILNFLDGNFYLCDGGACPTTPVQGYPAFTSQGNLVAGGTVYAGAFGPVSCPSGMIPVPASPADGQQGFCVDKYEAQSSAGNEVSVQGGSPWVSITQTSARAECIRAGKHLITEKEWMTIAHNAENVGWNWNGGVAGTNQMSDGHSDNAPASALATAADASACSGTEQTCDLSTWNSQRRVYKLSNDQYIWDLGGNVWEWVDQTVTNDYPIVNSAAAGWQACSTSGDGICGNTRTTNDQWYRGGFSTIAGFVRGGSWNDGANVGAFTLNLGNAPSNSNTYIGFRCSR